MGRWVGGWAGVMELVAVRTPLVEERFLHRCIAKRFVHRCEDIVAVRTPLAILRTLLPL